MNYTRGLVRVAIESTPSSPAETCSHQPEASEHVNLLILTRLTRRWDYAEPPPCDKDKGCSFAKMFTPRATSTKGRFVQNSQVSQNEDQKSQQKRQRLIMRILSTNTIKRQHVVSVYEGQET
ncbi:hypothetical protein POX_d05486 [Penicillium oxalicum]|uniref:Uncharacterized protein n=1 Tax=Penicillium oxalicum (strain 114-2 / CGMCC 5302) TaxID=933388 RepID=S8BBX0_PENO1|nr:hypothetical protein POX_d05486 [Penicillium oxalicum]EPS32352.1 hypothetical protein PDE_07312 [Penicillium oxalicum 114-2]KAI2789985.1 hypothetical protein POX_d05486 [Penicillium oxalicum]